MLLKENSTNAGEAAKRQTIGHLARDRLRETDECFTFAVRWQVSWLAGQRRTPIFPVAQ